MSPAALVGRRGQIEGGGSPREITVLAPPDVACAQVLSVSLTMQPP